MPEFRRTAALVVGVATVLSSVALTAAAPASLAVVHAHAGAKPPAPKVSPKTVKPGGSVTIKGTKCVKAKKETQPLSVLVEIEGAGKGGKNIADASTSKIKAGSWTVKAKIPAKAKKGSYKVEATCDQYTSEITYPAATLKVGAPAAKKKAAKLKLSAKPSGKVTSKSSITFTLALAGKPAPTGTATFTAGKKSLCKKVKVAKGKATCKTKGSKFKKGKNTIEAKYSGDKKYKSGSAKTTVRLKAKKKKKK